MGSGEIIPADERRVRTERLLGDPEFLDKYCAHLANGGDGPTYCLERNVRYSDVLAWVSRDDDRKVAVGNAESAGAKWYIASIIKELRNIGMVDIGRAYDSMGRLLPMEQIPKEVRAAIVAVESEELYDGSGDARQMIGYTKRVKFSDKLKALEMLGKHLQMFIDTSRVIHQGKVTLEDLIAASNTEAPSGKSISDSHGSEASTGT
jgi:hypothetical protein